MAAIRRVTAAGRVTGARPLHRIAAHMSPAKSFAFSRPGASVARYHAGHATLHLLVKKRIIEIVWAGCVRVVNDQSGIERRTSESEQLPCSITDLRQEA